MGNEDCLASLSFGLSEPFGTVQVILYGLVRVLVEREDWPYILVPDLSKLRTVQELIPQIVIKGYC